VQKQGAEVVFHDSWTPHIEDHGLVVDSVELTDDLLQSADLVIITTNHKNVDYARVVSLSKLVLDTRYATRGIKADNVVLL
jgi:UDP-N-acetyl-D-glucosamine dehydrogenase